MPSFFIIISFILLEGSGDALFDHIAECLADFVHSREIQDEVLPLGFTFSFPCEQEGLAKAKLVQWTKGFSCSGKLIFASIFLMKLKVIRKGFFA